MYFLMLNHPAKEMAWLFIQSLFVLVSIVLNFSSFGPFTFFYIYLYIFMGFFFFFAFETLIYSPILLKLALFANWKLTEFYILGKRKLSDFMITISNSF